MTSGADASASRGSAVDPSLDLGHGVLVVRAGEVRGSGDALWRVESASVDLGWSPRQGAAAGTAVLWEDQLFEVIARGGRPGCWWWSLRPWDETETIRVSARLDASTVERSWVEQVAGRQRSVQLGWSLAMAPLLGAAPTRLKLRWQNEWGFPATAATLISILLEAVVGGCGVIDAVARFTSDDTFLPAWLGWLAFLGPILLLEALIRLQKVLTQDEPMGSLLGLPLLLLEPQEPPVSRLEGMLPRLRELDPRTGELELVSPILRKDWLEGGCLTYRGEVFRLVGMAQVGNGWAYRFIIAGRGSADEPGGAEAPPRGAAPDQESAIEPESPSPGAQLRLVPPMAAREEHRREPPPSLWRSTLLTALFCFAPAAYQRIWARHVGAAAIWLTVAGALVELIGGLSSIRADLASASPFLILDLLLCGEALVRLGVVIVRREPVGSILGLPLTRLYRRWSRDPRAGARETSRS
jgi:hypothetical protein